MAWHLGDLPRAESAYAAWLAGDRDRMSNCHACEAATQGRWESSHGRDELALERWQPVLGGQLSCAEEPHRVLAYSLLPLLRLGRPDDARSNHLRGYRMARGNESLLPTIARHIEFCALTGNEARGLEILAEHARHLGLGGNPGSTLSFLEAAVLLLDRLLVRGLGDQATSGPQGRSWTVDSLRAHCEELRRDLVTRFDQRNGTDVVSRESADRLAQQPLFDRLPLGVSGVLPGAAPAARPVPTTTPAATPDDSSDSTHSPDPSDSFDDLLVEARRLRDQGHPTARQSWLAVEATLGDRALDDVLRAELATQRGMRSAGDDVVVALACFEEAAAAYRSAGLPGEAAVNEGRAAVAAVLSGRADEARSRADAAVEAALTARLAGRATTRHHASTLLSRAKVFSFLFREAQDVAALSQAQAALAETIALAGESEGLSATDAPRLLAILADAHHNQAALLEEDLDLTANALRAGADAYLRAGQPWNAADPLVPLARVHARQGDYAGAEAVAAEALRYGAGLLDPEEAGSTHLLIADLQAHREAHDEAVQHALEAARWLDEAGLGAGPGAAARHRLALSYQALGRHAEAAEVLQSALPDLLRHGDRAAAAARRTLGESLSELREHAAAAEQFAQAAQIVEGWGEPYPLAQLASYTAEALSAAGRRDEAEAAYQRAQGLWSAAGVPGMVVRTLRARAWLTFRDGRSADPGRALMVEAERTARDALAEPGLGPEPADDLRRELADTWRQLASLLRDVAEDEGWGDTEIAPDQRTALFTEAAELYRQAAAGFADCGDSCLGERAQALLDAARVRIELEQHEAATAQLKEVRELAAEHGELLAAAAKQAGSMLEWLERQARS